MLTEVPPYSHVDKVSLHADQFIFLGDQLEPFHHQVIFLLRSHWTTQAQLPVTLRMHGMHAATKEHKHSSLLLYGMRSTAYNTLQNSPTQSGVTSTVLLTWSSHYTYKLPILLIKLCILSVN